MDKMGIVISVKTTVVPGYDNNATQGADIIARNIADELSYAFNNIQVIQNHVTKARIINAMDDVVSQLADNGLCVFYFHGHGDSIANEMDDDETEDQVLVCYDGFLFDDELDAILRKFKSTQRVFTIIDSCSSATIIEWKYESIVSYPQIIHIAASKDDAIADATIQGGIMSNNILNAIYSGGYNNYTYLSFCQKIKSLTNNKAIIRTTQNSRSTFLNKTLFT